MFGCVTLRRIELESHVSVWQGLGSLLKNDDHQSCSMGFCEGPIALFLKTAVVSTVDETFGRCSVTACPGRLAGTVGTHDCNRIKMGGSGDRVRDSWPVGHRHARPPIPPGVRKMPKTASHNILTTGLAPQLVPSFALRLFAGTACQQAAMPEAHVCRLATYSGQAWACLYLGDLLTTT